MGNKWAAHSFKQYWLWESLNCVADSWLATAPKRPPEYWPLEWAQLPGPMKMAKSCKEGMTANGITSGSEGHRSLWSLR